MRQKYFLNLFCVFISAGLFYLASPNIFSFRGYPACAWIFGVLLFYVLDGKSFRERICWGMFFSITAYALILSWVANINLFLFVFFSALFAVQPVMFAAFFKNDDPRRWLRLVFPAALWVTTEFIRGMLIGGYEWTIGHSQAFIPQVIQIADVGGAYGISFVIILVNTCLYESFRARRRAPLLLGMAVMVLGAVWMYGSLVIRDDVKGQMISVCSIQPNIPGEVKADPDLIDAVVDQQAVLASECVKGYDPDLIVWPETAVTDDFLKDARLNQRIRALSDDVKTDMLIGAALLEGGRNYNSAVLLEDTGAVEGIYRKTRLLPFNEFFPLQGALRFLIPVFHLNNYDFQEGKKAGVFSLKRSSAEKTYFGIAICSEEGYPALVRKQVRSGAGFIVAMLNDAWFESDAAMMMHAQNGLMQAASFKRPAIRSSNSGLSCAIDRYGRLQSDRRNLRLNQEAVFHFDIRTSRQKTVYARVGNIFAVMCGVFAVAVMFLEQRRKV